MSLRIVIEIVIVKSASVAYNICFEGQSKQAWAIVITKRENFMKQNKRSKLAISTMINPYAPC